MHFSEKQVGTNQLQLLIRGAALWDSLGTPWGEWLPYLLFFLCEKSRDASRVKYEL